MLRLLLLFCLLIVGCSNTVDDGFWYNLHNIPVSNELKPYLSINKQIENKQFDQYLEILFSIERYETRVEASEKLFSLWEADPTNFLWIDLLIAYEFWFTENIQKVLLSRPELAKDNAVGNFAKARWNYGYGSRGEHYEKAWTQKEQLSQLQKLWLTLKYSNVLYDKGESQKAIDLLLKNASTASTIGGDLLESLYWAYISEFMLRSDYLDDALHACHKSWVLAKTNRALQIDRSITLSAILEAREEYTPALDVLDRCVAEAKEFNYPWQTAKALNNAASLCDNISQPDRALHYDKQNLKINLEANNTINIPRSLMNIAYDMRLSGQLDSCLVYMEKAKIWVDKYDEPSNRFGLPMHMAEYYCQIGDYATADSLLNAALIQLNKTGLAQDEAELHLKMIQQGLEMNQPDIAYRSISRLKELQYALQDELSDQNLIAEYEIASADFLAQQGEFKLSSEAHKRALQAIKIKAGENWKWELLRSKGELALLRNDQTTAISLFNDCLTLAHKRQNPDQIASSKLSLGKLFVAVNQFNNAITLFSESEESLFGGRFKTRLATLLAKSKAYAGLGETEKALKTIDYALELCNKYSPADIVAKLLLEKAKINPASAEKDLKKANRLINNSIYKEMPGFNRAIVHDIAHMSAHLEYKKDNAKESLLAALGVLHGIKTVSAKDYDIIYFLTGESVSFRWLIRDNTVSIARLPGLSELTKLTESILSNPSQKNALLPDSLSGKLCIIPDGPLSALPWYAMPVNDTELLIDKIVLAEVPNWTQLPGESEILSGLNLLSIGVNKSEGQNLLKEAEAEAISVGALWENNLTTILTGDRANLGDNPESILSKYKIIHIASHAKVHQGVPSRSTLRLAGVPLTIPAIASMNLDAELVYLSSCETARDISTTGAISHFANAFLDAGVSGVIASSVPVDDKAGKLLAEKFYSNLKSGTTKSESLRLSLIELKNSPRWQDPRYWGFVKLYGSF